MSDRNPFDARLLLFTLTAGCAVLGGLLGGLLAGRFWHFHLWQLLLLLVAGAGVALGAALLLTTDGGEAPGRHEDRPIPFASQHEWTRPAERALPPGTARAPQRPPPTGSPTPGPSSGGSAIPRATASTRPTGPQHEVAPPSALPAVPPPAEARVVLPLRESAPPVSRSGRSWWAEGRSPRTGGGARVAPAVADAPPLTSYDPTSALVAQCPNCGGFRLDVNQSAGGYVFRCRTDNCGATWKWAPGTPWPPVTVRHNPQGRPSSDDRRE